MRIVAVGTIFPNWNMFPEERTSLFSMAFIALFSYGIGRDEFFSLSSMGIVTIRAIHLTFSNWMMGCSENLGFVLLVAVKAEFWFLRDELSFFSFWIVNRMASEAVKTP